MSNLIKEAIADAKAVREMAVKQARAALEEAFAPQVDAIISRRLQTEVGEEEEELEEPVAEQEEEELEEPVEEQEDEELEEPVEEQAEIGTDPDHEKAKENSGLTEDEKSSDIGTADNKKPSKLGSTKDPGGEVKVQSDHDKAKESELTEQGKEEEFEDDVNLEEIIKELEDEANVNDEEELEEIELEDDDENHPELEEQEVDDEKEEEPVVEQGKEDEEDAELELEIEDDVTDPKELDLEATAGEEEDDEKELQTMCKENKQLKKKLVEALQVVRFQKNRLNEINILNAKLLFTNKVFSEYNLDDASKIKVIENFDRAKTVREVKLIFATLMENMKADKRKVTSKAQRLVEGASKAIGSTKSVKAKEQIVSEQDDVKSRVHKLMGLKNK